MTSEAEMTDRCSARVLADPAPLRPDPAAVLRPELPSVAEEILEQVRAQVPDLARRLGGKAGTSVRPSVERGLRRFLDRAAASGVAPGGVPTTDHGKSFRSLGRGEYLADAAWTRSSRPAASGHGSPASLRPRVRGGGRAARLTGKMDALRHALHGVEFALGPTVPLTGAASSLRPARQALSLMRRGLLPDADDGQIRRENHPSTLLLLNDEESARLPVDHRPAEPGCLEGGRYRRLAGTLPVWLTSGVSTIDAAERLRVHPQTVRYRTRRLKEPFGDLVHDPEWRFDTEPALRMHRLFQTAEVGAGPGNRPPTALRRRRTARPDGGVSTRSDSPRRTPHARAEPYGRERRGDVVDQVPRPRGLRRSWYRRPRSGRARRSARAPTG